MSMRTKNSSVYMFIKVDFLESRLLSSQSEV